MDGQWVEVQDNREIGTFSVLKPFPENYSHIDNSVTQVAAVDIDTYRREKLRGIDKTYQFLVFTDLGIDVALQLLIHNYRPQKD